jgi:hypothetical protein
MNPIMLELWFQVEWKREVTIRPKSSKLKSNDLPLNFLRGRIPHYEAHTKTTLELIRET